MPKIKLEFQGKELESRLLLSTTSDYEITKSYEFAAYRTESTTVIEEVDEETILQLTTEDEFEWIGKYYDLLEINNQRQELRSESDTISFPEYLAPSTSERSINSVIKNKSLDVITGNLAGKTAKALGKHIDKKVMGSPGLYRLDQSFNLHELGPISPSEKYLLLIHGTISSTKGSFGEFNKVDWDKVYLKYGGRVIAFDHYTISDSPYKNTLDLLRALPDQIEIDILSSSRGGLIADTLARCDSRILKRGFTSLEIDLMKKEDQSKADEMIEVTNLARKKNIVVDKIIRVACPASGTILLSKRLDHFLNFLLNAVGQAIGGKANFLYEVVKTFLLDVVKARHKTKAFPGLWAMVPNSLFQKINNNDFEIPSVLVSITGDSEIGGNVWNSIKVILTNLYYRQANDFVVNTKAMSRGLKNRSALYKFLVQSNDINHFKYFINSSSSEAISTSLISDPSKVSEMVLIPPGSDSRGVVLDILVELGEVQSDKLSGSKPIMILLPGIMGSNLHFKDERIWMDMEQIRKGGIDKYLRIDQQDIDSKSAIAKFYEDYKKYFNTLGYEVIVHSFDWRKSVSEEAKFLEEKIQECLKFNTELQIVSHSMGGLLVREWKRQFQNSWNSFKKKQNSKWIMLGTPWLGSYLVMEVITGHAKKVRQINMIDRKNSKKDLLTVFNRYKGVYELLPINEEDFETKDFWKEIIKEVGSDEMILPSDKMLNHFAKFKENVESDRIIKPDDAKVIYYIAGQKNKTVCGYNAKAFSLFKGHHFKYEKTREGDGSVTWDTGIPEGLLEDHLYFSKSNHTNLAKDETVLKAVSDIIKNGNSILDREKPVFGSRDGVTYDQEDDEIIDFFDEEQFINNIFDLDEKSIDEKKSTRINITVHNADLKWSTYPLMVGHFQKDGIVSAERALDYYLKDKLSERHAMNFYPGKIGEQIIVFDLENYPKGGIIVGLGDKDILTGYELAESVKKAGLMYALLVRDNFSQNAIKQRLKGVSTLLIGNAYGKLSMSESVRSIIIGIQNANQIIQDIENGLKPIEEIEFIDYYEDKAYECYKILKNLEQEKNTIFINVEEDIKSGYGSKKRMIRKESSDWWQSFTTIIEKNDEKIGSPYLKYSSFGGLANVSQQEVYSDLKLAEYLADELSQESVWNRESSKVIFELLLPNEYKDFVRNHRNIEWKMDIDAAQFPWEMFHDSNYGNKPTFVESGMIRQLFSETASVNPALVTNKEAIVIGDPLYKSDILPQLAGALEEAKQVASILDDRGVKVKSLLQSNPIEIVKALYAQEYKIIHIASHGVFEPKTNHVGIAIGDGQFLSPGTIKQMTAIPEFVFINCCYSGTIDGLAEEFSRRRNKLAANVGTQFIEMGVKAVVVAGWAVHDGAALIFAQSLYKFLYQGDNFGSAVRRARSECYNKFPDKNTWGAYQCYGDPSYKLLSRNNYDNNDNQLTLESEIYIELENILSSSKCVDLCNNEISVLNKLREKTEKLIQRAISINKYKAGIKEKEALILVNLGLYNQAINKLSALLNYEYADYSIKLMDKYCNVRAKQLGNEYYKDLMENIENASDEVGFKVPDQKNYDKKLKIILDDLVGIKLLGNSFSRFCYLGSTYKRAVMINIGNASKSDFSKSLDEAINNYLSAANMFPIYSRKAVYPLTSYIALRYFKSNVKASKTIKIAHKDETPKATDYLKKWLVQIDKTESDKSDIWDQLAETQLRICYFLISDDELKTKADKIISIYKKEILRCINARDLIGEIEYMQFLKAMSLSFPKMTDHVLQFQRIQDFLKTYWY